MNFIAFDTEDNSAELMKRGKSGFDKHVTQIACIDSIGNSWHARGSSGVDKFLNHIQGYDKPRVYAHNLQYDLGNLFGDTLDEIEVVMVGGRLIKAIWKNVTFLDSFNLFPMALKKVGKFFGLEKLEGKNFDDKDYVLRDVEIVHRAVSHMWQLANNHGVEKLPSTLGGLAVKIWKEMGGKSWHDASHCGRESLFGGRVELFRKSARGKIAYCDINSLYPSVMQNKFPDVCEPSKDLKEYGIAHVTIDVPECEIAPLPVRREDHSIYYPWGRIEGYWTCHEIRTAVSFGARIQKIHGTWGNDHGEKYYSRFVQTFYKKRKETKSEALKLMYKLLMNNLYGQLAMSGNIIRSLNRESGKKYKGTHYGIKKLCETKMPLPDHCNYIHAAYVTSYGRLELQKQLRKVRIQDLVYCDTDSIIYNETNSGGSTFHLDDSLGGIKLEGTADEVITHAPKMYQFGSSYKAKGVRGDFAAEFIRSGRVAYDQPYKFREAVQFFDRGNSKKLSVWRRIEKELRTTYNKKSCRAGRYFPIEHKLPFTSAINVAEPITNEIVDHSLFKQLFS